MSDEDWVLLILLSILWGGTFFFAKIALAAIAPMTLVFARVALAALALGAALRLWGIGLPRTWAAWRALSGMGFLNNVLPFSLIFWGQHALPARSAASLASVLNATTPVFAVVVAHFLTRDEKMNLRKIAGVLAGFAGVAVMLAPNISGGAAGADPKAASGMLACLSAALIYAFAGIYGRRFKAMGITPPQVAFGQLTASSVMMAPVMLIADRPWAMAMPGPAPVLAVLALAIASTALAYVLYFRILASAGATNLLLVTFLIPVTAILLSAFFLGERLGFIHLSGMALIALSLAIIDGRLFFRRA